MLWLLSVSLSLNAQDQQITPTRVITGEYLGETPPLRDLPTLTEADWQRMVEKAERKLLNPKLRTRSYPFAATALPQGPDPVWQRQGGADRISRAPILNFNGQDSPYYPPDANGSVGPNHYMQTINTVYAIYDKSGMLVAGPSALNTLFAGVAGSTCNDGDPIVLYDEQANRWLVAEFSICGSNDYLLVAVSTTSDPTGTWHKYSFDVADMPDYPKFGIWRDGYYLGTNNSTGNDIYVLERDQMLIGGTAQAVGFNNPWRPTTIDGFMCVPPLDNDGPFAPEGEPGLFITINDDAIGGGSDQLWIYELDVDWTTPSSSTFTRSQQVNVAAFDSNFGSNWDNIKQLGTSQELDAIPQVIMNPPQYRNFNTYETILCCHTVDVDATDHAGIRWYELRRVSGGDWTVRQQGTYAPDSHSRWMGSIVLNGQNEIGLGYSVSSSSIYPAIRYCGQSADGYATASGILDVPEEIIQDGVYFQSSYNRWGDYSGMQVDPTDDDTFWFTSEYIGTGGARKTKIASFIIGTMPLAANFSASTTTPLPGGTVAFTDLSTGSPTSWSWEFEGGTPATSTLENPTVTYDTIGIYDVTLTVSDGDESDTETKTNYIQVDLAYCASGSADYSDEWIAQVAFGSFTKNSGAAGYSNFTSDTIPVNSGETYSIILTPAYAGTVYAEYWKIWIDYNHDGDFSDSGEEVFTASNKKNAVTGSVAIPSDLSVTTRMRVSMKYGSAPGYCESFTYGEVEDFTILIGPETPADSYVYLKTFLQGAYNTATDLMRTDLNAGSYLPLLQPYATTPLAYEGTESVTSFNADAVDWVVVELRTDTLASTLVARQSALLLSNGWIVGTDQVNPPLFNEIVQGNSYYVVIYHRNHFPVMTASAIILPNTQATRYDLTASAANAYRTSNAVFPLETGVYGQIAGDVNWDKLLRYSGANNDKSYVFVRIGSLIPSPAMNDIVTGYYPEDVDMNGIIRYSGTGNDPAMIFTNIDHFTDPTYTTSTWISVVPVNY